MENIIRMVFFHHIFFVDSDGVALTDNYEYDTHRRLIKKTREYDDPGKTELYEYDYENEEDSRAIEHVYDMNGNEKETNEVELMYDANGRIIRNYVYDDNGELKWGYDKVWAADGNEWITIEWINGRGERRDLDERGRIIGEHITDGYGYTDYAIITYADSVNADGTTHSVGTVEEGSGKDLAQFFPYSRFEYDFDKYGNVITIMKYDLAGRLAEEIHQEYALKQ